MTAKVDNSHQLLNDHIRQISFEIESKLSCNENKHAYFENLCKLSEFVTERDFTKLHHLKELSNTDYEQGRNIFLQKYYSRCCDRLLINLSVDVFSSFSKENIRILNNVFVLGPPIEAFMVLYNNIKTSSFGFKLHKCVSLMEHLLREKILADIFWDLSSCEHQCVDQAFREQLTAAIVSLPETVTNRLQKETGEAFYPRSYVPLVCMNMYMTLQRARDCLGAGSNCSLLFVSHLLGKLALTGHADCVWECLLPVLYQDVERDYVWCRICERVVTGVPARSLESLITSLLKHLPWYGLVGKFMGDSVVKNLTLQNLLCTKLLLHRHSTNIQILHNIIGYLASSHTRQHLVIKVLMQLLEVWGDGSHMKHSPYPQHLYISQALLISLSHLTPQNREQHRQEILRLLMSGVSNHVDSSSGRVRTLGMVVAQTVTRLIDPSGPQLQFEYEESKEMRELLSLSTPPQPPSIDELARLFEKSHVTENTTQPSSPQQQQQIELSVSSQKAQQGVPSDLDSDDDLEAYDMSHDTERSEALPPKYLGDCLDGLLGTGEGAGRVEVCLREAESLIRRRPHGLQEICVEMSKVLLHLDNQTGDTLFIKHRFSALVALAVHCPTQVADYLCGEFYERNYNIRQRLDILEVLGAAAQELSKPAPSKPTPAQSPDKTQAALPRDGESSWREVVEARIKSKTRRLTKGRTQPVPQPQENRFSAVSGHFFYPLMKNFDRKENTLDLLGADTMVFSRLLYTLGLVLYSAVNTPAVDHMATTLLQFTWAVRIHADGRVRQAVLFSTCMLILAVPAHRLMVELSTEILELKSWLQGVAEHDMESECRQMAVQALLLLDSALKQELMSSPVT